MAQRNILRTWRGVNPFPIPYRTPSAKVCAIPATVALVLLALQFVFILLDALRSHINEGFLRRPRALPRPPKVGKIMAQYLKKAVIPHTLGVQVWGSQQGSTTLQLSDVPAKPPRRARQLGRRQELHNKFF